MNGWYSKIPEMVGEDWIPNQVCVGPEEVGAYVDGGRR